TESSLSPYAHEHHDLQQLHINDDQASNQLNEQFQSYKELQEKTLAWQKKLNSIYARSTLLEGKLEIIKARAENKNAHISAEIERRKLTNEEQSKQLGKKITGESSRIEGLKQTLPQKGEEASQLDAKLERERSQFKQSERNFEEDSTQLKELQQAFIEAKHE